MEKFRSVPMVVVTWSMVLMVWLMLGVMGGPVLHKVGGSKGWTEHGVNYTEWSTQENVYVGDWLIFKFDKRYYNVLEVNETSYESCMDRDFIKNVTRGGRDVVQLTEAKTYYFISAGGYCFHGMRLAVHVRDYREPAVPAPAPLSSAAVSAALFPSTVTSLWLLLPHFKLF
ncbi:hypothetical protein Fmac_016687 [Flemingia macrophylla]|uniref:Phytocyanin domain-containing protein n=1 Tax=Flemingia macrophylla TaxID=520843 RepID=A0ABD1MI52_9FABA